jgi:hypothetical protein
MTRTIKFKDADSKKKYILSCMAKCSSSGANAGCCQVSATNNSCASYEYSGGKCVALAKKTIGCSRAYWNAKAKYDARTNRCVSPTTGPQCEDIKTTSKNLSNIRMDGSGDF